MPICQQRPHQRLSCLDSHCRLIAVRTAYSRPDALDYPRLVRPSTTGIAGARRSCEAHVEAMLVHIAPQGHYGWPSLAS